jgi:hypothetical protein
MAITEKQETLTALSITNVVLGVLVLAIAVGGIYVGYFYEPEIDLQDTKRYVSVAQERLTEHADEIAAEAADLAKETMPPIGRAVYAEAKEDYPRYLRALKSQGKEYLTNVEAMLVNDVKAHYDDFYRAHRQVLKEEFPDRASDKHFDQIARDFEKTTKRIIERYYLDEFRQEAKRTGALWDKVEPVPIPEPNQPSLEEQLADYTADWTVLTLAERADESESTKEQPAKPQGGPSPDKQTSNP